MKKRILSVLLCLCMVLALLPTMALAATGEISDEATLRTALQNGGTYTLTADVTCGNTGNNLQLTEGTTLTITGNGQYTIAMSSTYQLMIPSTSTMTLENLTINGGSRCIENQGTLTMEKVTLEGANQSFVNGNGAGLYNAAGATAILTNCNIRDNTCSGSGGLGGGFYNAGTLIMENCAIVGNKATGTGETYGGGGYNCGTLYMNNCTVANNQSGAQGGGIYHYGDDAKTYLMNSTVTGNITAYNGGGIYKYSGSFYAVNSVFAFNYAGSDIKIKDIYCPSGPNLYSCAYGTVTTNDTITGCTELTTANSQESVTALFNAADSESSTYARPAVTSFTNTNNGFASYGVYPKDGSALLTGGTATYYDRTGSTVKMSYGSADTPLGTLGTTDNQVNTYQDGTTGRTGSVIGALPKYSVYTVTVQSGDHGTASADPASAASGTTITLTATPDANYRFQQWTSTPSVAIDSSNKFIMPASDVTVTANFIPMTYSVTFRLDGGTINSGNFSDYIYGQGKTLPTNVTKTGNDFLGWTATDDANDTTYITQITTTDSGEKTFYARWTPKTYTVSFDLNGATGANPASISVTYNDVYGELPTPPDRPGYTFAGWYNSSSGGSKVESTTQFNYPDNQTLYARWTPLAATAPGVVTGDNLPLTYGYTTGSISVSADDYEGHSITGYQWYSNTTASNTSGSVIDGATGSSYTIPTGKVAETTEYYYCVVTATREDNGQTATATSSVITVTVGKANGSLTAPTAKTGLVYNGSARELIDAGSGTGGEIQYKLDNGDYGTAIPTATNAGTYTVYYKLVGDANHNDVAGGSIEVTIGKATLTVDGTASATAVYGTEVKDISITGLTAKLGGTTIEGVWNFPSSATNIPNVGDATTYTATFTPSNGADNYNPLTKEGISLTISQVDHPTYGTTKADTTYAIRTVAGLKTYTLPCSELAGVTYTVTGKTTNNIVDDAAPAIDGNTLTYTSKQCGTAGLTDTITIKITSTNYNDITLTLTVTASNKTNVTISGLSAATGLIYNGSAQTGYTGTPSYSPAWTGEPVVTYYLSDGTTKTTEANSGAAGEGLAPKNAGSYKVTVAIPESDETHTGSVTLDFTINKAVGSVTAPTAKALTYTGEAQVLINAGSSTTGTIQYKVDGGDYSTDLPAKTNAGTYTVSYKVVGDANHNDVGEATVSVTINKATPAGTPTYTAITTSGKTLADANLGKDNITPVGTIKWVQADGITELDSGTVVVANTSYKWLFSPTDTTNYNTLTGSITPYVVSYSGGGSSTSPTYKVESEVTEDTDGSVSFSTGSAKKDDIVTITVTPDRYYKVDGVVVKDSSGNEIAVTANEDGTFTFQMPASQVTVEPVFSWDNPFTDVAEDTYYAPAVEWALKNDVTNGTGDGTTFSPDDGCTRAQIVTFLWHAAGCPEPAGTNSFTDVSADAYYAKAVAWAVEQGITDGTGGGKFSPDAICTRSQGVTFLYRAADFPEASGNIAFSDVAAGSYYADAVAWAARNGVTNGTGDGKFSPGSDCTRAQIMTFLYRWLVK